MNRREFIKLSAMMGVVSALPLKTKAEVVTPSEYICNENGYVIVPSERLLNKHGMKLTKIPSWKENNSFYQIKSAKLPIISPTEKYILSEEFVDVSLKHTAERFKWNRIYVIIATLPKPSNGHDWSSGHYEGMVVARGCKV